MVDARNSDSHTLVTHSNNAFSYSVSHGDNSVKPAVKLVFSVTIGQIGVKPKKNTQILIFAEYCKMLSPKFHRNT